MAVEETSYVAPASYNKLFDLQEHLAEAHDKDMESILLGVFEKDRENQFKRKVAFLDLRDQSQNEQDSTNEAKVANYRALYGVYLDGASVVFSAFAAYFGQTMAGGLMQVAQQAFSKTGEYQRNRSNANGEVFSHRYTRIGSNINDQNQQIQSAERDNNQMYSKGDQLLASIQRIFELMASSTS
jgi:hypothetical protein